jgi:LuxR family maltose regulon positive regulatory protein
VTPDAAMALSGIESARLRLRSIARRGLLVHEVGAGGPSFRYHNLLRGFLLEELERARPGATRELHARAAAWYADAGSHELALEHALLAGDAPAAARLAAAAALPTLYAGRAATLDRWLATFDDATLLAYPPLAVVAAWTHIVAGRPEAADRMADLVEAARFDEPPEAGGTAFEMERAMLRALMCRRGPAEALANAEVAAASETAGRRRTTTQWLVGSARWLLGDVPGAEAALEAAADAFPSAVGSLALAKRAAIRLHAGDWQAADELATAAAADLRATRWDARLAAFYVHAVSARVAIARGDIATGRGALVRAQLVRPSASHAAPWVSVDALLELARAYLSISDPAGAQTALREAEAIIRHRPGLGALVGELVEVRRRIGGASDALAGSSTLTSAELRVLPLLPTYLSFQDIADRLGISRNTVKTHAMSIYGKLWASSRGEAVERAVELGLLEPYPGLAGFRGSGTDGLDEEAG